MIKIITLKKFIKRAATISLLMSIPFISGCGKEDPAAESAAVIEEVMAAEKGLRDNTPECLIPEATGTTVYENETTVMDASNIGEGYFIIQYIGSNAKVKLQVTDPAQVVTTYSLAVDGGKQEVFPLSGGDGTYLITVYENITGKQYAVAFTQEIDVTLNESHLPFLYPNQYVEFESTDETIAIAEKLAYPANTDLDVVSNVFNYCIANIEYDYEEAETVQSGYIPDIDEVISTGKGICLDYAAVMTSMLRSQKIPTRMEVGYAGTAYHAWISTYIEDIGWVNGIVEFDGTEWKLMDPTFARNATESSLKEFIGDGSNYTMKFKY